jgi:hypothetical protein
MAQEQKPDHKTNRGWHLDTSLSDNSNNSMNFKDDSVGSDTTRVTSTTPMLATTTTSSPEM